MGYYRFTGYLHPFRMPNSDVYRPNTTRETVWDIYMFDRHLRLMAIDALAPFVLRGMGAPADWEILALWQ